MTKTYTIRQVQLLNIPVETAWAFFSDPLNLVKITPASLDFKIISDIDSDHIYTGQLITYKVRPLLGISVKWLTRITAVENNKMFVDEQLKGPYKLWRHEHHFKPVGKKTEMTDIVQYQIPFGFLGTLTLPLVKRQLNKIFKYRRKVVESMFNVNGN